jgi:hypothetical protein
LNFLATATQDIATGIDFVWASAETGFGIEAITGGPEAVAAVVIGVDILYNITGANAWESIFSGLSLIFTYAADSADDGQISETTLTSAVTFGLGLITPDPIIDLAIDGYASGYNHGVFNGVDTIMNGGPTFNGKWTWY